MAPPADSIATVLAKLEEMSRKMDATGSKVDEANRRMEEMQASVDGLKLEQGEVNLWKPKFETKVTKLQNSVHDLKKKMDLFLEEVPERKEG
jgi:chromosome segregation ATPase